MPCPTPVRNSTSPSLHSSYESPATYPAPPNNHDPVIDNLSYIPLVLSSLVLSGLLSLLLVFSCLSCLLLSSALFSCLVETSLASLSLLAKQQKTITADAGEAVDLDCRHACLLLVCLASLQLNLCLVCSAGSLYN